MQLEVGCFQDDQLQVVTYRKAHQIGCDPAGSVGSREHWLWDTARKRNAVLLFSIVLRIFQLL